MSVWAASFVDVGSDLAAAEGVEGAGASPGNDEKGLADSPPGVAEGVIWRDWERKMVSTGRRKCMG